MGYLYIYNHVIICFIWFLRWNYLYIYRIMDQEDSKKVKQTDPDVNAVPYSDSGQGNKDASGLPLKR